LRVNIFQGVKNIKGVTSFGGQKNVVAAHDDRGLSGGSSVRRPESKDPNCMSKHLDDFSLVFRLHQTFM
jgi:hypothetical protein